jgi:3-hydroxyisobutyrate dehydrogenase-like beta-hydroxyacid dehydrogenase
MKIAFIGFGEAARAFAGSLREHQDLSFSAYDILLGTGEEAPIRDAAARLGVRLANDPAGAVADAEWIVSAVTAADSLDAARSVSGHLGEGQVFVDINSVSAGRKRETAKGVAGNGAAYVDMAVMAPVHPRGHRTPVLIAGPACDAVKDRMSALGFSFEIAGPNIGDATAIKMVRSMFVKGLEVVTVQALLAARASGCLDAVMASLSGSFPQFDWAEFPNYQIERMAHHGIRRAAEMEESAVTMRELGLPAGHQLGQAIAALELEIGGHRIDVDDREELVAMLDKVLAALRA